MNPATIIALIELGVMLVTKIKQAVDAAKQSKEWTPEQEAVIDAKIAKLEQAAHWQV